MAEQHPTSIKCYHCQKSIPILGAFKVTRTEECPYCSWSLHCCKMCKFYDPQVYNECTEPNADRVVDKEKANFCDYFRPTPSAYRPEALSAADKAKAELEALFGHK